MAEGKNYYQILGVDPFVTPKDLKSRFRKIIKIYHPDLHQGQGFEDIYREILEAYDVLSSPHKRFDYDHTHSLGKETYFYGASLITDQPPHRSTYPSSAAETGRPSWQRPQTQDPQEYMRRIREERRPRRPPPRKNRVGDMIAWTLIILCAAGVFWLILRI